MRLALLPALLLAACSPNPTPSPVAAPAPASPPVPFRQLGWDSDHFTWEGKPFTGTTTDHYKSGALKCRYGIRNGRYHGLVEEWYENGNPKTRTAYEDGRHEGDNFYWNPDGSLQSHKNWKNDSLVSESHPPNP